MTQESDKVNAMNEVVDAEAPDVRAVEMDLESSNSSLDITNATVDASSSRSIRSKYPKHKPPPPPPKLKPNVHRHGDNDSNAEQKQKPKQSSSSAQTKQGTSSGSSALSLFSSAKKSISRGAQSLSTKTSQRMSLRGQLKQARASLSAYLNPKIIARDKTIPRWVLKRAKGLVFLTVVKAGVLLGVSAGTGVCMVRRGPGGNGWSAPVSIGCAGIAAGLLAGASKIDYIMVLPNESAIQQFTGKGQLRLGADIQLAVGPLGRDASGSVGAGDQGMSVVYSYSHAAGLYGGLSLDGKVISVRGNCNQQFYGKPMHVKEILLGKEVDAMSIDNEDYTAITEMLHAYCVTAEKAPAEAEEKVQALKETAVFGVNATQLQSTPVTGYASAIPNVLIVLKENLFKHDGHRVEGIFRTAAQKSKRERIRQRIDDGQLRDIDWKNVHPVIIAQLIKLWFRESPKLLMQDMDLKATERCETVSDTEKVLQCMSEPQKSYFYWLLDLCIEIADHSSENRMDQNNMAVVMAPNLYRLNGNVAENATFSTCMVQFVCLCIELRVDMNALRQANQIMDSNCHGNDTQQQITSQHVRSVSASVSCDMPL